MDGREMHSKKRMIIAAGILGAVVIILLVCGFLFLFREQGYQNYTEITGEVLPCEDKQENIWLGEDASVWNYEY